MVVALSSVGCGVWRVTVAVLLVWWLGLFVRVWHALAGWGLDASSMLWHVMSWPVSAVRLLVSWLSCRVAVVAQVQYRCASRFCLASAARVWGTRCLSVAYLLAVLLTVG